MMSSLRKVTIYKLWYRVFTNSQEIQVFHLWQRAGLVVVYKKGSELDFPS